jgi:hypothetical protein
MSPRGIAISERIAGEAGAPRLGRVDLDRLAAPGDETDGPVAVSADLCLPLGEANRVPAGMDEAPRRVPGVRDVDETELRPKRRRRMLDDQLADPLDRNRPCELRAETIEAGDATGRVSGLGPGGLSLEAQEVALQCLAREPDEGSENRPSGALGALSRPEDQHDAGELPPDDDRQSGFVIGRNPASRPDRLADGALGRRIDALGDPWGHVAAPRPDRHRGRPAGPKVDGSAACSRHRHDPSSERVSDLNRRSDGVELLDGCREAGEYPRGTRERDGRHGCRRSSAGDDE